MPLLAPAMRAWAEADAWDECCFDLPSFLTTLLYESVPAGLGGLLCWAVEGHAAAENRELLYVHGGRVDKGTIVTDVRRDRLSGRALFAMKTRGGKRT